MCGILGIYNYANASVPLTPDLLTRLRDTMTHRGPDDAGLWLNEAGRVGLAHRRLSIIDLSADGRQPMTNEDRTLWITFNGEIYNYRELRGPLERQGHRFRSHSDTEVILHLYEDIGPECVSRLDGMFAFGLWDENRQSLFLARDRLGVKPLYYTQQHGLLLFASEIKALLAHPLVSRDIDSEALYHYLTFKSTPAPQTLFAGIFKLPAGCHLVCDRQGNTTVTCYWDAVSASTHFLSDAPAEEASARVRQLLTTSVTKRLVADVPVGLFLSGGLDSSALAALMAPQLSRPLNTFSVGINDVPGGNELPYAQQVARQLGTNHHEILIGRRELEDYLPQLVHSQDEPLADPVCVPLFYLARLARQTGTVVVQVGEGSDEQFLGYESRVNFLKNYERWWRPLLALPRGVRRGLHAAAGLLHRLTGKGRHYRQLLGRAVRESEFFWGSVAFTEEAKSRVLNGYPAFAGYSSERVVTETLRPLRALSPHGDMATLVAYLDIKMRLAELLLMRIDKVTMSCGVEAREPFLDYHLVEYLMTLPQGLKIPGWDAKHLLKQAMRDVVPETILRRPKQAFAAPVNLWLRAGLEKYARHVLLNSKLRLRGLLHYEAVERLLEEHTKGQRDHGVPLWALMNLSAWYDHWIAS
jgi:asparagine synthase (glutamine-hydrolysing)